MALKIHLARNVHTVAMGELSFIPLFRRRSDERSPQASHPPDSNGAAILPPEIFDKILEHIPTNSQDGRQTLRACALVATWWTGPSQRRLFSSVVVHEKNRQRWMDGVILARSRTRLLGYIRSVRYCHGVYVGIRRGMRVLARDYWGYFSALSNLHSLTLFNIEIEYIGEDEFRTCFSKFRETLTYLSIAKFRTSFGAFVTLVDYFPNVRNLHLDAFSLGLKEGPVPNLSRPLRGRVSISFPSLDFLDRFTKLDLQYDEVVLDPPGCNYVMETGHLERGLRLSTGTAKILRLNSELPRE